MTDKKRVLVTMTVEVTVEEWDELRRKWWTKRLPAWHLQDYLSSDIVGDETLRILVMQMAEQTKSEFAFDKPNEVVTAVIEAVGT